MTSSEGARLASFDVVLQSEALAPGDTIAGIVFLHITHPVVDAKVTVELRGRERVEAIYHPRDHDDQDETYTSEASIWSSPVDRRQLDLVSTDGLTIPFSAQLPTDLPPTTQLEFDYRRPGVETHVRVEYDVVCSIHIPRINRPEINHSSPFTITALPLARRVGQPVEKCVGRSYAYGFFKSKPCRVRAHLNSDVFTVESQITACVDIELEDREMLQSVSMALWRRLEPSDSHPRQSPESTKVASSRLSQSELVGVAMPSLSVVVPPSVLSEGGSLKPTLQFHHFAIVYEVVITCEINSCLINVSIPVTILPSACPGIRDQPQRELISLLPDSF